MYSSVITGAVIGIEPHLLHVETNIADGLPSFQMVGFLSKEIREEEGNRQLGALLPCA